MHRTGLIAIMLFGLALALVGGSELTVVAANRSDPDMPSALMTGFAVDAMYLPGFVKLTVGLLLAAVALGFDGVLAAMADMRRRHPGVEPPFMWGMFNRPMACVMKNPHALDDND